MIRLGNTIKPRHEKNLFVGLQSRSDTNRAVQPQNMARRLNSLDLGYRMAVLSKQR